MSCRICQCLCLTMILWPIILFYALPIQVCHFPLIMRALVTLYVVAIVCSTRANEDLRVSSNFFDGNYHSITPDRTNKPPTRRDDVLNHLGKPLVAQMPAVPTRTTAQPGRQRQTKRPLKQLNKSSLPSKWARPILVAQPMSPTAITTSVPAQNSCRWITLQEMGNVSYATGEVIIRDASDQPCYIITMRAYIKWNEDAYFPLQHYRAHPVSPYKIEFGETSEPTAAAAASAAGSQRLLLNCSLPPENVSKNIATVSLMSAQRANRTFSEEITIQVSCGHLVLRLNGDGTYLALESVSFYQDGNVATNARGGSTSGGGGASASGNVAKSGTGALRNNLSPPIQSRHLVFTTEGQPDLSPLIVMPTFSRYICQNRVVLTGNNSVQLVFARFELKRLTNEPVGPTPSALAWDAADGGGGGGGGLDARSAGRDTFGDTRPRRDVRTTTILYKNPMIAVTRCSNPTTPGVPLTSMMDRSDLHGNDTTAAAANKLVSSGQSSIFSAGYFLNVVALGLVWLLNSSSSMQWSMRVQESSI